MSLRFIFGRAGVGKTRLCLDEIKNNLQEGSGKVRILLVPEQATFQMERILLEHCEISGTIDAQVLSFQRLAWRVLQETGGGLQPVIDDLGKSLVLRLLIECHGKELQAFNRVMDKPGFIDKLRESITEFKVYRIETERLRQCLAELDSEGNLELQAKLEDLTLIYEAYQQYLSSNYLDGDDYLLLLADKLSQAPFLREAEIWVDGFHGFTPVELQVLGELMRSCRQVNITLCMDGELRLSKLNETNLFYPPWETYQALLDLALDVDCPLEQPTVLTFGSRHRFSNREELAALESYLATKDFTCPKQTGAIKLVEAGNRRMELEGAATEIIRLCREEGLRYKDIGLLFRNYESYEDLLPDVFAEYEIPYFADYKRTLLHHPVLDLLQGALEVAEKGWHYEAVFRYLKTDLIPVNPEEIDLLENYCLAFGIRGNRWTDPKPWTFRKIRNIGEDGQEQSSTKEEEAYLKLINCIRQEASSALIATVAELQKAKTALEYAQAIYQLLENLEVAKKLEYWANQAEKMGNMDEVQIHGQVWERLIDLLDQLVEVLADEELTIEEFAGLVESGLASIQMGLIPLGLDQVLVGSIDRTRNPALKAVFVLGLNEGVLPGRHFDQRLINDSERQLIQDLNVKLAPTSTSLLYAEQFAAYNALTRASDYLWISYPLSDEEGKSLSHSPLISRLAGWLDACGAKPVIEELLSGSQGLSEKEKLSRPAPTLNGLVQSLRRAMQGQEVEAFWWDVYNWYQQRQEWRQRLQAITAALWEENTADNLTVEEARTLYGLKDRGTAGNRLTTSISRLEKFKACPFAHFVNYGLRLKEREVFKLKSLDLGQLFHAALEKVFVYLKENSQGLVDLSLKEIDHLVEQLVDSLIPQLQNELLLSTARYRYLTRKLKRIVKRSVRVLREHERRGSFRPIGLELSFGPYGDIPGLQLTLQDGTVVELQGRIDRADGAICSGSSYLRIIDYKSGFTKLSLWEVYYGLKLQLLSYLDVLFKAISSGQGKWLPEMQDLMPGGILYFAVQDPMITSEGPLDPERLEKEILKKLKMQGFLLKDQEVVRIMDQEIRGHSDIIPAALNTNGEFRKDNNNLWTTDQFADMANHVEKILTAASEEILSGETRIAPVQHKEGNACKYCAYKAICRFDTLVPGYNYRNLMPLGEDVIWTKVSRQRGEDSGE